MQRWNLLLLYTIMYEFVFETLFHHLSYAYSLLSLSFLTLSPDQAREQFKARVNEVAYIKADSKVSDGHCVVWWRAGWGSVIDL